MTIGKVQARAGKLPTQSELDQLVRDHPAPPAQGEVAVDEVDLEVRRPSFAIGRNDSHHGGIACCAVGPRPSVGSTIGDARGTDSERVCLRSEPVPRAYLGSSVRPSNGPAAHATPPLYY